MKGIGIMSVKLRVWDPLVRVFHWALVAAFAANVFVTAPGKAAHQWVGYAVAGLIALRLVWGFVGTRHARFADFMPGPDAVLGQMTDMATGRRRVHAGHSPLGAIMIFNLLLTMAGLAVSGYAMTTLMFFGVEWVEEVHEALVVWAEISVVVHVLAVVVESRRLGVNLPKSMVTGYKTLP
jgi:cytochrome b